MKRYGTSAALALMFGGAAVVIAGCLGDLLETPTFDFQGAAGAGAAGGASGTGGAGGCTCQTADPCYLDECMPETCDLKPAPAKISCGANANMECNGNGECRVKIGAPCKEGTECSSGSCADGVCCNESCSAVCQSCNVPGSVGTCTMPANLPDGWPDDSCNINDPCKTDKCGCVMNACSMAPNVGQVLGEPCGGNFGNCLNNKCVGGYCRLPVGGPCNDSVQCETNYCNANNKCAEPQSMADCGDNGIDSGQSLKRCNAAPGEPCGANGLSPINCIKNYGCNGGICRGGGEGAPCTADYQCFSSVCDIGDGGTSGSCAICPNSCLQQNIPNGEYCRSDQACISGKCTGFPQKCQPQP